MDSILVERYISVCYTNRYVTYHVKMVQKEEKSQVILEIEPLFS